MRRFFPVPCSHRSRFPPAALGLGLLLSAGMALAQPRLLSSEPSGHAEVAPLARMDLHFSEKLLARRSDAHLTMTSMPGMSRHPEMGMAITVTAGDDPASLRIAADQPLPRGSYRLDWRAVSARHKLATGRLVFTVK